MGTIVSNSHTLNRVGLFSDFIFVNVNDMNIYFFRIYIYSRIFVCTLLTRGTSKSWDHWDNGDLIVTYHIFI